MLNHLCLNVRDQHLAKFRSGVAPIRLKTGIYENIQENLRLCPICKLSIENEIHVLFECFAYHDLRQILISKPMEIDNNFVNLNIKENLIFFPLQQGYCKGNYQNLLRFLKKEK
jgi:hypothetical protein